MFNCFDILKIFVVVVIVLMFCEVVVWFGVLL